MALFYLFLYFVILGEWACNNDNIINEAIHKNLLCLQIMCIFMPPSCPSIYFITL